MVRKYGAYLKEGLKASKMTMKRRGTKIRYYMFYVVKFLSILLPYLIPIIAMAEVRMSKNSIMNNDIDVLDSFKTGCKAKKYWSVMLAYSLSFLFMIGGVFVIALVSGLFILLGDIVAHTNPDISIVFIKTVFSIPGLVLFLVFAIIIYLYFAPIPYIGDTIDEIDGSNIIKKSVNSMRKGKLIIFLNTFIPQLIVLVTLFIPVILFFVLFTTSLVGAIIYLIFVVVYFGLVLYFIPTLLLGFVNAKTLLYEDIVLDDINVKKSVRGIIVNKSNLKNNLLNIFNHTENSHIKENNSIDEIEDEFDEDEDEEEFDDEEIDEEFEKAVSEDENSEVK